MLENPKYGINEENDEGHSSSSSLRLPEFNYIVLVPSSLCKCI